ncbi:hypothetical protein IFM89_028699 [Coptis chinensis]|uniref:Gnk2-homologous domain-containing protein n=1 Tax=Coptis chinensis TaxID=261450 RepID=A0A835LXK2_9MAGN|nr:hypothetical protein IFM89_028699 [Coptis chinensis]
MTIAAATSYMLFLPLSLLLLHTRSAKADNHFYRICQNTTTYTNNSAFESNLNKLLKSLPSETSFSDNYYNTSAGEDPSNQVFGLTLCRGDINSTVCNNCIEDSTQEIKKQCPNAKDATIFYQFCQVRYSSKDFFTQMGYDGKYSSWNTRDQNMLNPDTFAKPLRDLLTTLLNQAINDPSNSMFASGEVSVTGDGTLYGLVQCTRDLSKESCKTCLERGREELFADFSLYNHSGGILLAQSCNLRYELYRFYQVSTPSIGTPSTDEEKNEHALLDDSVVPSILLSRRTRDDKQTPTQDYMNLMDFSIIQVATNNFSDSNKLGQGGFGTVYKGTLPDGKEVAIKRLSRKTRHGLEEFMNEVNLISKLQEPVDTWLQNMPWRGLFSVKSDVYSFGVVLLEILCGKRGAGFYLRGQAQSLLTYAWHLWNTGRGMDFVEPLLIESCSKQDALRCIHIGLLCVQEDAADRPSMSFVLLAFGSESLKLPQPRQPAFSVGRILTQTVVEYPSSTLCLLMN